MSLHSEGVRTKGTMQRVTAGGTKVAIPDYTAFYLEIENITHTKLIDSSRSY